MAEKIFLDLQWRLTPGQYSFVVNSRDRDKPPLVTIFGCGITGLSVAQELIERGFGVQVVEAAQSTIVEYGTGVGGMAANQFSRVPGDLGAILGLRPERPDGTPVKHMNRVLDWPLRVRGVRMRPAQPRYPLNETIVFKRLDKAGWLYSPDDQGVTNEAKLQRVLDKLYAAFRQYHTEYRERMCLAKVLDKDILVEGEFPIEYWREILAVRVLSFTFEETLKRGGKEWAKEVIDVLIELDRMRPDRPGNGFKLANHLVAVGRGEAASLSAIARRQKFDSAPSNRVEFEIIEQVLPGEHGFRFFPGFYRNLFDTMKRVPAFDRFGVENHETAHSHLVPAADPSVSVARGKQALEINYRVIKSLKDLEDLSRFVFESVKFTERDVLRLQLRLFRYLTSCKARRIDQCERETFWKYIGGEDKNGYSDDAAQFIQHAPRALAAMAATEVDARTQANILIQMLVRQPFEAPMQDYTLDGSTSQALLDVWKTYLDAQGVKFFTGRLERIELGRGWVQKGKTWEAIDEFIPIVTGPDGQRLPRPEVAGRRFLNVERHGPNIDPGAQDFDPDKPDFSANAKPSNIYHDFFVLALSLDEASRLVQDAWKQWKDAGPKGDEEAVKRHRARFSGPFRQLIEFDAATTRKLQDPAEPLKGIAEAERDAATGAVPGAYPDHGPWPYRDISGIQYFFPNRYRFGNGHVYLAKSAWGLTAISQLAYARDRTSPVGRFLGQVSVDIGDWYAPWKAADGVATASAWRSNLEDIANVTWKQMLEGLDSDYANVMLLPQYYHLDWGIRFQETESAGFAGNILAAVTPATHESLTIHYSTRDKRAKSTRRYRREQEDTQWGLEAIAEEINSSRASMTDAIFAHPIGFRERKQTMIFAPYVEAKTFTVGVNWETPFAIAMLIGDAWLQWRFEPPADKVGPGRIIRDLRLRLEREDVSVVVLENAGIVIDSEIPIWLAVASLSPQSTIVSTRHARSSAAEDSDNMPVLAALGPPRVTSDAHWDVELRRSRGKTYLSACVVLDGHEFFLSYGDRNRVTVGDMERPYEVYGDSVATRLANSITNNVYGNGIEGDPEVFAWYDPSAPRDASGAQHIVLSPMVKASEIVIHILTDSKSSKKLGGSKRDFAVMIGTRGKEKPTIHAVTYHKARDELIQKIKDDPLVADVKGYGDHVIWIRAKDDVLFSVANADDCIHIEAASGKDPVLRALRMRVRHRYGVLPLQFLSAARAGTADTMRVNVAGKGELDVPDEVIPGRTYGVRANLAGKPEVAAKITADFESTSEHIANAIFEQLSKEATLQVILVTVSEDRKLRYRIDIAPVVVSTVPLELALTNVRLSNPQHRTPLRNATPFLINLPDQWKFRPGLNPKAIGGSAEHAMVPEMRYTHRDPVLHRWVPAGTWMATHTRMTTMEAANESAKHAVSGMLHMIMTPRMGGGLDEVAFGAKGTLLGDFPAVYRLEDYEFRDLDNLRKVDEKLMAEKRPHFMDILRLVELVDKLPATGAASDSHVDNYRALLKSVNETLTGNRPVLGTQLAGALTQSFMDKIENYLKRNFSDGL